MNIKKIKRILDERIFINIHNDGHYNIWNSKEMNKPEVTLKMKGINPNLYEILEYID
jgi:hypothetical protein